MFLTKRFVILFASLLLLIVFLFKTSSFFRDLPVSEVVVNNCRNEKVKDNCYAENFSKIAKKHPLEYTLTVLDEFQKKANYPSCHFIGHVIASVEVKKNPKNWVEILTKFPSDKCSGGFIMGTLEAVKGSGQEFSYNSKYITDLCQHIQKMKNGTAGQSCIHSIGHLLLVEKKGNINDSIAICKTLNQTYHIECMAGIFMENEYKRNLSAMDVGITVTWNEEVIEKHVALCKKYTGYPSTACWREISHMFLYKTQNDLSKVKSLCEQAERVEDEIECFVHARQILQLTDPEMF